MSLLESLAENRTATRIWKNRMAYLFLLPALIVYAVFVIYPFFGSIQLSLTDWNGASPVKNFVGLQNYVRLARDPLLWKALQNTLIWVVLRTILPISIGLFLAVLLWQQPKGFTVFRTVYFMPQVLSPVIIGIIWGWVYAPRFGILNRTLDAIGLESVSRGWLADPDLALYAVLIAATWSVIGFFFVIILAGLQSVDISLLEAAELDGANAWQRFRHVIIPQLSNVLTLTIVLSLLGSFKVFDIIWVMTGGGPANQTEVLTTYTYLKAFMENEVGYAAAISMIITILSLISAVIVIRIREREE